MTELQGEQIIDLLTAILAAVDGLEWCGVVIARTVSLSLGFAFFVEVRRMWTQGSGLF